jgi:thiosulfate/3-mercaptopyruvate sulfurtransferase
LETPIEDIQIKGARTFDIKTKFSDTNSPLPNTVPNSEAFATACRKMGIHNGSKIVVYDTKGIYSSPRAWWLLRSWDMRRFGYSMAACLDKGGYATEKDRNNYMKR